MITLHEPNYNKSEWHIPSQVQMDGDGDRVFASHMHTRTHSVHRNQRILHAHKTFIFQSTFIIQVLDDVCFDWIRAWCIPNCVLMNVLSSSPSIFPSLIYRVTKYYISKSLYTQQITCYISFIFNLLLFPFPISSCVIWCIFRLPKPQCACAYRRRRVTLSSEYHIHFWFVCCRSK